MNMGFKKFSFIFFIFSIFVLVVLNFSNHAQAVGEIEIDTCQELQDMEDDLDADYILIADVDCNGFTFVPVGNGTTPFTGTLEGDDNTISDLTIIDTLDDGVHFAGLFGSTNGAVISNVNLVDGSITAIGSLTGALVGYATNVTIENVSSTITVDGESTTGGLVGQIDAGSITDSYSTGDVTGTSYVGGLIGEMDGGTLENVYASGNVTATGDQVGGLVGATYGGTISNSYATGDVTGVVSMCDIGGLVGENYSSISNSYATGDVTGECEVGGLAGAHRDNIISNSYATGNVEAVGDAFTLGGLVGALEGDVDSSYSTGAVSDGDDDIGGLVGGDYGGVGSEVTNSFWNTETSGQATSAGGTGKTTAEMKTLATYTEEDTVGLDTAWDFVNNPNDDVATDDFWQISYFMHNGYPSLTWQDIEATDGDGSEEDPYQIDTCDELQAMQYELDANYILIDDVDCDGFDFVPVGDNFNPFTGTLDGNNKIILNLSIEAVNSVGLFGKTSGATISDLTFEEGSIHGTSSSVGALIGWSVNTSVENVESSVDVTGDDQYTGGLVGLQEVDSSITNSHVTGNVTGHQITGGLVGENDGDIVSSYATGDVTADDYEAGGLVGWNNGSVTSSYATGDVISDEWGIGGLVGENSVEITNSYATGTATSTNDELVGGLVGLTDNGSTISNSYSIGAVSAADTDVGGLIGYDDGGTITDSFWNTETSGQATSAGGTGKTTAEMKTLATFTSWDMVLYSTYDDETWFIDAGADYPRLSFEYASYTPAPPVVPTSSPSRRNSGGNVRQLRSPTTTPVITPNITIPLQTTPTQELPPPVCSITLTLRQGNIGEQVKCLQKKLNIPADGIFGPITKATVILFQKSHSLVPDGIVGPKTRRTIQI